MIGPGHSIGLLLPSLRHHLEDETITDVLVNNETEVWVERTGHLQRVDDLPPGAIDAALERVLTPLGRRLDRLSPMVDARLDDGTRVCAVIAPIAVTGTCAAFRLFRRRHFEPGDFAPEESTPHLIECLRRIDVSGANVLISGATGSGKTSLASTLIHRSGSERTIILEDTREIVHHHEHALHLEARPATAEGRGSVSLDDLLRTAMRLRPDRIVVGEIRGPEALTLLHAMSTGHRRCLATIHANSAVDGLHRMEVLALQGLRGWTLRDVRSMVDAAVGYVIHMSRAPGGGRVIDHIGEVPSGRPAASPRLVDIYRR